MSSRSGTTARRAALRLAVLGLAAAMSSPALAESGVPDVPVASVPDVEEVATAVIEEAGLTELEPLTALDPPTTLPAVPAQTTAAEPVTAGAVAAPPPEPVVEAPVAAAPIETVTPDAPAAPAVEQSAPANVNVSVRVDSPGDNGAVSQMNVGTATSPQYQPDPPQYQPPIPTAAAPAAELAPEPAAVPEPAPAADDWNWTWSWNCGDATPEIPIAPDRARQNWVWNWEWNCQDLESTIPNTKSENASQYQPVVSQYRPININISIRINSPGNDGPVFQTNVAVVVTPPALPRFPVELPSSSSGQPQNETRPSEASAPAEGIAQTLALAEQLSDPDDCCVLPRPRGVAMSAPESQSVLLPQPPPAGQRDIAPRARFRASVAVTVRIAEASAAAARAARPAPKPARAVRPAPRRPVPPTRERVTALSAAGLAPLNAPDGRLGYLVLLVVGIAFTIAFADASRSVAAEVRAAGEDPDPPPDHPG